jgi:hypothetical protein
MEMRAALAAAAVALVAASTGLLHGGGAAASLGECLRANIGGQSECLAPRLACSRRYEQIYEYYALTCSLAADGHYRLRNWNYIGPAYPS